MKFFFMNETAILFKIRLKNLEKKREIISLTILVMDHLFFSLILKINISFFPVCFVIYFVFIFLCLININLFLKLV